MVRDPAGQAGKPQLFEFGFSFSTAAGNRPLDHTTPGPNSKLAACYNHANGIRTVFYQDVSPTDSYVWYTRVDKTSGKLSDELLVVVGVCVLTWVWPTGNKINFTNNSRSNTPLAAISIARDGGEFMYLYYVDNSNLLLRTVYSEAAQSWTTPGMISTQADPVGQKSSLAVVADLTRKVNLIYYRLDNKQYSAGKDNW